MRRAYILIVVLLAFGLNSNAQDFGWGIKGGPLFGFQKWNTGNQRDALIAYHAIAFIETVPEGNQFSTFAQVGYHVRGGAVRVRPFNYVDFFTGEARRSTAFRQNYKFNNISLTLGAKQKYDMRNMKYYYMFGIRGDFTISTNLQDFQQFETQGALSFFYPQDVFVRKLNYGLLLGGGFEKDFSEYVTGLLEITINPDISKQYNQVLGGASIYNPATMTNIAIGDRVLSNLSLEISVGIRFLTKVEYVD